MLKKADHVLFCPFFSELPVRDAMYRYGRHLQVVTCARSSRQVTFMLALGSEARDHLVSFGDLVLDLVITRGRFPENPETPL